jgi:predicted dinucleotide-binding enzyme
MSATSYAVLGTGVVGRTLGSRLVGLGHRVVMGSRQAGNETAVAWAAEAGDLASQGSFADAAAAGDTVINATAGTASVAALESAGGEHLAGKVLIDVGNPLDASQGMPPRLSVCNDDSLGEQLQRAFPDARVVKTLNTVNCDVMVKPSIVPGRHTMFVCGNDAAAKRDVCDLLVRFEWPVEDIMDLGDIAGARGMEMYLPLWLRLWGATGTGHLNVHVACES